VERAYYCRSVCFDRNTNRLKWEVNMGFVIALIVALATAYVVFTNPITAMGVLLALFVGFWVFVIATAACRE
jgi:hypothetical protein